MSSPSPSLSDLSARITSLELSKRRLERTLLLASTLLCLPLLSLTLQDRKPPPDRLIATGLAIVDPRGDERLVIGLDDKQQPRIEMRDAAQKTRFLSQMRNDEMLVTLRDGNGETRLGLAVDGGKHPHLTMSDSQNRLRLHSTVNHEGAPSLLMRRADGSIGAGIGLHGDGRFWQILGPDSRPASAK